MGGDEKIKNEKDAGEKTDLRTWTKALALQVICLYSELPRTAPAQVIGRQVLRSGTSVGAQYREAARAKSDADFISKLEGALQELDETQYWIELLVEGKIIPEKRLASLLQETDEIIRILVSMVKKVNARKPVPLPPPQSH
jgi:four helix bundle protein